MGISGDGLYASNNVSVWGENWTGRGMPTAERQRQIQLLEVEKQAWAFEGI